MKASQLLVVGLLLWTATSVQAGVDLSSSQTLEVCKSSIRERTDGTIYHRFRRDHAISTRGNKYTFWINSTLENEERRYLLRSKCITSKQGELLSVEIEEGRW